jgi:hypothetical protein
MTSFPGKGLWCGNGHKLLEGGGKCAECAREFGSKAAKDAALHEDEEEWPDSARDRIAYLEEDVTFTEDLWRAALTERDSARIERNKISIENSRLRLKLQVAADEIAHLKELMSLAESAVGKDHILHTHLAKSATEDSAMAGAGVRGVGGRNIQACARCRARKQVCDGDGEGPCARCMKAGVECEYAEPAKRGPKGAKL